jgi:hypothetical protein
MNFSQWFCFARFFPMSDIEDDISLGIFSGNFYLQDNIGSETTHYKRYNQLESVEHNPIYGQVL